MQNTQRKGPKSPQLFPREQRGSEGVTRSRCPARCQEPQGFEKQPGRWLPSAPGTSCHCRSPTEPGSGEKTIPKPRQPKSSPSHRSPRRGKRDRERGDATRAATQPDGDTQ